MLDHLSDISRYMEGFGFEPTEIIPDGGIHRFGPKKRQWYICFRNHSIKTGEEFYVCQFGDWSKGVIHQYEPERKLNRAEKRISKSD